MAQAINEQINKELFSGYLYKSMAVYAAAESLNGTTTWMNLQEGEERAHAQKFMDYLLDQGEQVILTTLADLAVKENDYASTIMLPWFITEQVEEEKNAMEVLSKLKMIGSSTGGLYMLDKELGKRKE